MKKQDAELKANALRKDLVGKNTEHKESNQKYTISSLEVLADEDDDTNYKVFCLLKPGETNFQTLAIKEEIDFFLTTYKVLIILEAPRSLMAS